MRTGHGDYSNDERVVMTLDAGGTNFVFSAMRSNRAATEPFALPSHGSDLERSLNTILDGFDRVRQQALSPPVAISFAFPGPADYENGIIAGPRNLPAYRNVALGPMLEDTFGLPVFLNNDGDLFTYGESMAGLLPFVNRMLERAGSPKRFHNLLGVTIGTGLGGGIVRNGELFKGDNSIAGEMWLLRSKAEPSGNAEEQASIRAVRRAYAQLADISLCETPEPKEICDIAEGRGEGNRAAAVEAFRRLGEAAGDAIAQAVTLVDGLVVIGGGVSGAHCLFLPALVEEMNATFLTPDGTRFRRLVQRTFNLEDPAQLKQFIQGEPQELCVPEGTRRIRFDALQRTGVGLSRLGTSQAIATGAYAFALKQLDSGG